MKHDYDPRNLNLLAFAKAGDQLYGDEYVLKFERLLEETQGVGAQAALSYHAVGSIQADAAGGQEVWVHLEAKTVLPLICQRCLSPVEVDVAFSRDFRFVETEALAAVEDEESEEDVLVLSRNFNLADLVEDELLMALPVSPKHDVCPHPVKFQVADADFDHQELEKPNPFAVLEQIKKPKAG